MRFKRLVLRVGVQCLPVCKQIVDSIATKVDWKKVLRSFVKASQKSSSLDREAH